MYSHSALFFCTLKRRNVQQVTESSVQEGEFGVEFPLYFRTERKFSFVRKPGKEQEQVARG